jgi:hypothetical protein
MNKSNNVAKGNKKEEEDIEIYVFYKDYSYEKSIIDGDSH